MGAATSDQLDGPGRRRLGATLKVEDMTENIEEKMFRRMKHAKVKVKVYPVTGLQAAMSRRCRSSY